MPRRLARPCCPAIRSESFAADHRRWRSGLAGLLLCSLLTGLMPAAADEAAPAAAAPTTAPDPGPLHQRIDQRLAAPPGVTVPLCSDADFLRRVSLDLTGMPPRADEARAFLNDTAPDKRVQLIDRLLSSPLYDRHLAATLDLLLMERRANTHVSQDEWLAWLVAAVRDNKPWNVLAREILLADGDDPALRAPARFYLDRSSEPNVIARDIGRTFFGRDLQCAQCHDSPLVADFLQADYQGLLAFTAAGYEVKKKHGDKDVTVYAERSGTELAFESVFNKGTPHRAGARLPGMATLAEPLYLPGEDYTVAPADAVRAVPRYSRRAQLAELATNGGNSVFNENIANRLWAHMMGRGLVHPLDMLHPDNPGSDPVLLRELAQRFSDSGFDIRGFLRELALTQVYQRPFDVPGHIPESAPAAAAQVTQLTAQLQELTATRDAAHAAYDAATTAFDAAETQYVPVSGEYDTARNAFAEARKKLDEANAALATATAAHTTRVTALQHLQQTLQTAQQASQLVPEDQELAAVVKKFSDRTQQLTAELPALQTAVEDKTKALTAPTEALAAARQAVEAVSVRLQPLKEALRQAEESVVAARQKMQTAAAEAGAAELDLAIAQRVAGLPDRQQAILQAEQAVAQRTAAAAEAMQQLAQHSTAMAEAVAQREQAQQALTQADTTAAQAVAVLQQRQAVEQKLAEANVSLGTARDLLAGDAILTAALTSMSTRVESLRADSQAAVQQRDAAVQQQQSARSQLTAAEAAVAAATSQMQVLQQAASAAQAAAAASTAELETQRSALREALDQVATDWSSQFALANLKPLTPEQLCWSVFRVTTVYERYAAAEVAELDKTSPLTAAQQQDPAALQARAVAVEQRTFDKLKGNLATWVQFYGGGAGQPQGDFYASADQALFTSNGGSVNSWVSPAGDNPAERIIKATDPRLAAEELYLGVLTRWPTEDEVAEVSSLLAASQDRARTAQELVWGLLNSAEFRFNH